jgi:ribosome-associated protein
MTKKASETIRNVTIETATIELSQLLKFLGLAESGGEAKIQITSGKVRVNGAVETRKSKKIVAGDVVEFQKEKVRVAVKPA